MSQMSVGETIRAIRTSRGITASHVARELGYKTASAYTRIEKDQIRLSLENAKKIADILMVDVNDFFSNRLRDSRKVASSVERSDSYASSGGDGLGTRPAQ